MACARPSADKKTASSVDGNEVIGAEDAVATIADSTTPILPPVQKPHVHGPGCCGGHGKASSHARRVVPAEDTLAGMIAGEEAVSSIPHM